MSEKTGIEKLREHLFAALSGLQDKTVSIETAKAMSDVSQTIINSARAETEFHKLGGRPGKSDFFPAAEAPKSINGYIPPKHSGLLSNDDQEIVKTQHGIVKVNGNSRVHVLK